MTSHPYTLDELRSIAAGAPLYDWAYVSALLAWAVEQIEAAQAQPEGEV